MRERVLAIVGAVALIAVALLVRSWLADDDAEGGGSAGGSGGGSNGQPVVACTSDLAAICEALADDGRIAEDPPTLDLADSDDPPTVDGWITWDPAPFVVNENAGQGASIWSEPEVLGSAPLGVLLYPDDDTEFDTDCNWTCITERVGQDWPVGVGSPSTSEGLARWRPLAQALVDASDGAAGIPQARIDAILNSPANPQNDLTLQQFLTGPGRATAYIGLGPVLSDALGSRGLELVEPEPATTAAVVVAARNGEESVTLADHLGGDALNDALAQVGVTPGGTLVDEDEALGLWHVWNKAP